MKFVLILGNKKTTIEMSKEDTEKAWQSWQEVIPQATIGVKELIKKVEDKFIEDCIAENKRLEAMISGEILSSLEFLINNALKHSNPKRIVLMSPETRMTYERAMENEIKKQNVNSVLKKKKKH